MKEKIDQLEHLLNEITQEIEDRLRIEAISEKEYDTLIYNLEKKYFTIYPEEKRDNFNALKDNLMDDLNTKKNDHSFFEDDIPRLKSILTDKLSILESTNHDSTLEPKTRFGSRLKGPNRDFLKMLQQDIVTTETHISGVFHNHLYGGHLTDDGYFSLLLSNRESKLFSSLSTAASFICDKPVLKGWEVWYALDKNGKKQPMNYFRNSIKNQ